MGHYNGKHGRGYSRTVRETKRLEAEERNQRTDPSRRRSARELRRRRHD